MRSLFFLSGMRIMLYCVWWTTCIFLCFAKEQLNISVFLLFCWIIQFFCFQFFCLSFIFIFWLSKNRKLSHAISAFFQQQIFFFLYIYLCCCFAFKYILCFYRSPNCYPSELEKKRKNTHSSKLHQKYRRAVCCISFVYHESLIKSFFTEKT